MKINPILGSAALVVVLLFPAAALGDNGSHVVQSGEVLGAIASRYDVSVDEIRAWNGLNGDLIRAGQTLRVAPTAAPGDAYVVMSGDTLGAIAMRHEVSVDDIVAWNPGLRPDRIFAGQELLIRTPGRARRTVEYTVESGDFVGGIASRHDCTVNEIANWNPGLDVDTIRIGQTIRIVMNGPEVPSNSVGRAYDGRLENGEQLPPHRAYVVRNPRRSWGTNETVSAIVDAFDHMRDEFDTLPRVRVHDLSFQEGGDMDDHHSHQSGRDADIGYYQEGCRRDCAYESFRPSRLDVERQWSLLEYWIQRDLVEYVFIDYGLQEVLYDHLAEQGMARSELSRIFQYPRGRDVAAGIIRHEPNHADHLHVRFSCPHGDERCR